MPKLNVAVNIADIQRDHAHGFHDKHGIVMHETVSGQIMHSTSDVVEVSKYVAGKGYGIHAVVDNDGNIAAALGLGRAVFYHASSAGTLHQGKANTLFIGIELVSDVMVKYGSRSSRIAAWFHLQPELNAAAKLIACYARAWKFPIVDNPGNTELPGITTHYEVTKFNGVSGGHVDAWPSHLGGYFPKRLLIKLAKRYYALGWHF